MMKPPDERSQQLVTDFPKGRVLRLLGAGPNGEILQEGDLPCAKREAAEELGVLYPRDYEFLSFDPFTKKRPFCPRSGGPQINKTYVMFFVELNTQALPRLRVNFNEHLTSEFRPLYGALPGKYRDLLLKAREVVEVRTESRTVIPFAPALSTDTAADEPHSGIMCIICHELNARYAAQHQSISGKPNELDAHMIACEKCVARVGCRDDFKRRLHACPICKAPTLEILNVFGV